MSTTALVRCNSTADCKIVDVRCSQQNGTELLYCQCHNTYFMTADYSCEEPALVKPTFLSPGLTSYSSIFLLSCGISFLVVVILVIKKFYDFRKKRINKVSASIEEEKDHIYSHVEYGNSSTANDDTPTDESEERINSLYLSTENTSSTDFPAASNSQSEGYRSFPINTSTNGDDDSSEDGHHSEFDDKKECLSRVPKLDKSMVTDRKKIGEGYFGYVFKGHLRITVPTQYGDEEFKQIVATKILKQNATSKAKCDFWREAKIMSSFRHPNILSLLYICPEENNEPPEMVFEYMEYGDLKKVLKSSSDQCPNTVPGLPRLSLNHLLSICHQIAVGMECLASQRYVHRDLACRNCLVGPSGTDLMVKISDFGLSRDVYCSDYYQVSDDDSRRIPVRWMSPESIAFKTFTKYSDVWSYGVVLWEIFNLGMEPYYGYSAEQVYRMIVAGTIFLEIPQNCPREVADIMRACWRDPPTERIQFPEICRRFSVLTNSLRERNQIDEYVRV